jgi:hypothetical protein
MGICPPLTESPCGLILLMLMIDIIIISTGRRASFQTQAIDEVVKFTLSCMPR